MSTTNNWASRSYWPAKGLATLFDYGASSDHRAVGLLLVVALLAFLPGFFQIPPVDRDEAYFAQATKQMIETGDYVDIRYQDDVRYRKPVGIYWLQAAVVNTASALGVPNARGKIWLYRIPSLIGATGAVLLTYWCALAFVSRRGALLAALMMLSSTLLGVEARLAKTDAVLLFTVIAAMGVLARAYLAQHRDADTQEDRTPGFGTLALFWTAIAVSILVKGPLILMFLGLAALMLSIIDRSARWLLTLRPLTGILWVLLIVMPWFIAIYLRVGREFLIASVGEDMLAKVASSQDTHGAPPGLYFLLFFITFFPASMLAGLAAPAIWAVRREPAARFLLAWLVPSWIVFEIVVTKLPHYVLPLYPAVAILIAGAVESKVLSQKLWLVRGIMWWFLAPIIISLIAVIGAVIINRDLALLAWPFFALAVVFGLFAWQLYDEDGAERSFVRATVAAVLMAFGNYAVVVPSLEPAFPSVALAQVLHDSNCAQPVAASVGYEEPSLVFLAGTKTRFTDASGAADFLMEGDCHFAFVDARQERTFALRAEAIGLRYSRGPRVEGYNISIGRPITLAVFQSAGAP
ncbi:MAG TPA: glycosyltransferase family 39 protein [Xanthobacteraceae bacterium]|jgi:4-amino-4-deoxy-L-arabinose transferase-like glycosyltransferase|nr:glycosyltransferase family 39 protein [Xanthobacteraceae bacterium]